MKVYNVFDKNNNFVKGFYIRKYKDIKLIENFFDKDLKTINEEIAEKGSITKCKEEYTMQLVYVSYKTTKWKCGVS